MKTKIILGSLLALGLSSALVGAAPLGTAFTYQGRLADGGTPATGIYDLNFALFGAASGDSPRSGPMMNTAVAVSNGLFTVTLDFGPGVFVDAACWLEIAVRTNGGGTFTTLAPRQALTPSPSAIFAANAGLASHANSSSVVLADGVSGASLQGNAVTTEKIADGTIAAADLSPVLASNTFWRLDGNAGTTPGGHFLGTADNQPLDFQVNRTRALHLEPTTNAPNVIGGSSGNYVAPGVVGAAITGGGNPATPSSNRIFGSWSFIGAGTANEVSAPRSVIAGGVGNTIEGGAGASSIGGGSQNLIQTNNSNATLSGGYHNQIGSNALWATISGGYSNAVGSATHYATIPGGSFNAANADYTFAAGHFAQANHRGAFVWADSGPPAFTSTTNDQFLIRAYGGVGIGTNNPQSALHVAGTVTADAFTGSGGGLSGISGAAIGDGAISSSKIADGAVGSSQLASNLTVNGTLTAGTFQGNGAVPWQEVTNTSVQAEPSKGYAVANASQVTITLPASPAFGDIVRVSGAGAGWTIAQNPDQAIRLGHLTATLSRGVTWTPRESIRSWTSVASSSDGAKLVALSSGDQIYTSTDSGVTWTARAYARGWVSVASSSDGSRLIAVARGTVGGLFFSANSGASWTGGQLSDELWSSVASSADGSILAAVVDGGQIWISTNSGSSFTARESSRGWSAVASSENGTKLVATANKIYTSTDSGVTWTPRESIRSWTSVASSSDGAKLIAAVDNGPIYTSTDSGVTWTPRESNRRWSAVASSADGAKLVAAVDNGQIYISTDSGVTWTPRESNRHWTSVASSSDGAKLVAAFYNGQIYTSEAATVTLNSTTTPGSTGHLDGEEGTAIELQYIGNNLFLPLSHEGELFAY